MLGHYRACRQCLDVCDPAQHRPPITFAQALQEVISVCQKMTSSCEKLQYWKLLLTRLQDLCFFLLEEMLKYPASTCYLAKTVILSSSEHPAMHLAHCNGWGAVYNGGMTAIEVSPAIFKPHIKKSTRWLHDILSVGQWYEQWLKWRN